MAETCFGLVHSYEGDLLIVGLDEWIKDVMDLKWYMKTFNCISKEKVADSTEHLMGK